MAIIWRCLDFSFLCSVGSALTTIFSTSDVESTTAPVAGSIGDAEDFFSSPPGACWMTSSWPIDGDCVNLTYRKERGKSMTEYMRAK